MSRVLPICCTFLVLPILNLLSQITINAGDLPEVGDTLVMAIDEIPTNISLGSGGPDQTWEFSNLQAPFAQNYTVEEVSTTGNNRVFDDADYRIRLNEGVFGYYKYDGNTLRYLGTSGTDPLEFGLNVSARMEGGGLIEYKLPVRYGDRHSSEGFVDIPFASEDLPKEILDQLPIRPDSFRIKSSITRSSEIDGWGTLLTEAGNFQVLREKRTEVLETTLEAKFLFLPWQDISDLLPENDILGERVSKSFHFISNEAKEPIAVVHTNEEESKLERVVFKSGDLITKASNFQLKAANVLAFPNPAIISARFQFSNLPAGNYQLKIFSLLGKELWGKQYFINGSRTEKVDITQLRKGAYFYSLINSSGKTLMTRRLIVLRP